MRLRRFHAGHDDITILAVQGSIRAQWRIRGTFWLDYLGGFWWYCWGWIAWGLVHTLCNAECPGSGSDLLWRHGPRWWCPAWKDRLHSYCCRAGPSNRLVDRSCPCTYRRSTHCCRAISVWSSSYTLVDWCLGTERTPSGLIRGFLIKTARSWGSFQPLSVLRASRVSSLQIAWMIARWLQRRPRLGLRSSSCLCLWIAGRIRW